MQNQISAKDMRNFVKLDDNLKPNLIIKFQVVQGTNVCEKGRLAEFSV